MLENWALWSTIVALIAFSVVVSAVYLRKTRMLELRLKACHRQLRQEIHAVASGSIGVGQRLIRLEKKLISTSERQQELEAKDMGNLPYSQATKLMEMGAQSEDLVKSCGLSQAEADLVALMHNEAMNPEEADLVV